MTVSQLKDEESTWIDKMHGYLKWKVRGPDIHNPYAPHISNIQLNRLVNDPKYLRESIELRCTCDGYEVLVLTNLESPRIRCDHPCLNVLTTRQIVDAIGRHELDDFLQEELTKIKTELNHEIERRKKEKKEPRESSGKTLKELKQEREEQRRLAEASTQIASEEEVEQKRFRSLLK